MSQRHCLYIVVKEEFELYRDNLAKAGFGTVGSVKGALCHQRR